MTEAEAEARLAEELLERQRRLPDGSKIMLDLDRGLSIRGSLKGGIRVAAYKDTPGEYYLYPSGAIASDEEARAAGFNVEGDARSRLKREKIEAAKAEIEAEVDASRNAKWEVVAEADGLQVIHVGLSRHIVEGPDGTRFNATPLGREPALALLLALTQ